MLVAAKQTTDDNYVYGRKSCDKNTQTERETDRQTDWQIDRQLNTEIDWKSHSEILFNDGVWKKCHEISKMVAEEIIRLNFIYIYYKLHILLLLICCVKNYCISFLWLYYGC